MEKLDEKDKLLIEYLMHNCRLTTTKLSKLTGMKQPTVVYRMKKLGNKGYISSYDAIFDFNLIKTPVEIFFIKTPENKKLKFEEEMKGNSRIKSLFRLANQMNYLVLGFFSESEKDNLKRYFQQNKLEFKNYTWKKIHISPFSIFNLNLKRPYKEENKKKKTSINFKIDEKDLRIINSMMYGGGRDSVLKLSEKTGLNSDVVLYRLKRLTKANAFPLFLTQPGTKKFNIQVDIILLKLKNISSAEVVNIFSEIKKTLYIAELGKRRYFTQLLTKDFWEFKDVLEKICNKFRDNLIKVEVFHTKEWVFLNRPTLKISDFHSGQKL